MRKTLFLSTAMTAVLAFTVGAHASTYTLTFGGSDSGSVTVTGSTGIDPNSVFLTSGSGTIDGSAVTLVVAPGGTSPASQFTFPPGVTFDNELYPGQSALLDDAGLEFVSGNLYFVPYWDPTDGYGLFEVNNLTKTQVEDTSHDT